MDEKKYRVDKQDYAEGVYKDGPVKKGSRSLPATPSTTPWLVA